MRDNGFGYFQGAFGGKAAEMIRLFKSRVYVSVFTVILLLLITFSVDAPFFYIAIFCAFLHELAHAAVMRACGVKIDRISVYPFGVDIKAEGDTVSYSAEILYLLAGPCANLVLGLLFLLALKLFPNVYLLAACIANFLMLALNIMPVRGLDGGRALFAFLLSRLDFTPACKIFSAVSTLAFGIICFGAFSLIYVTGYNLSLVFICIYMFFSEYIKSKAM